MKRDSPSNSKRSSQVPESLVPGPGELFRPNRIVSGGQTGVDRAGLDAAIAIGIDHGGWCPAGRLSEDGMIPDHYQLTETKSSEYPVRTKRNVADSDATLILFEVKLRGGTLLTQRVCRSKGKPSLAVRIDNEDAVRTQLWLADLQPNVLNIAGPRESNFPGIEQRSLDFLMRVFGNTT